MSDVLSPRALERLSRLDIGFTRAAGGARPGDRSSSAAGAGTLFLEHRTYTPGDDLRYVDWNAYARLRDVVVKVHEREESVDAHLFVDASASMTGDDSEKLRAAARVAAALGAVALARGGCARLVVLRDAPAPPKSYRGRRAVSALLADLASIGTGGRARAGRTVPATLPRDNRRGIAIIASDFLDDAEGAEGWRRAVDVIVHRRVELLAAQVIHPDERSPRLGGALRLADAETGEELRILIDDEVLAAYSKAFDHHVRRVAAYVAGRGGHHLQVSADEDELQLLRRMLRAGVLK